MKKGKRGFTLVEVAIFLAVTGVLFLGVTAGVQTSVYQQRRNDSVQNFIEFLRSVYSEVENVQNDTQKGNSEQAIYGKLVTFGESKNLAGYLEPDRNKIFVYTVVGDVRVAESGTATKVLSTLNPGVWQESGFAGYAEEYIPKWGATIDPGCSNNDECYRPVKGALLIVRHPNTGTIWTFYRQGALEVNDAISSNTNPLGNAEVWNSFSADNDANFCVNPSGELNATDRTNVRIVARARNASGVEQVPDYAGVCGANF